MVDKVLAANIQNLVTDGASAARLINDEKRAINELIDRDNALGNVVTRNTGIGDNDVPLNSELETVLDSKQARLKPISNVAALRSYEPAYDGQLVSTVGHTQPGVGGLVYRALPAGDTTPDDGGYVVVTAGGRRWSAQREGSADPSGYGALSSHTDSSSEIQSAINVQDQATLNGRSYNATSTITLNEGKHLSGGEGQQSGVINTASGLSITGAYNSVKNLRVNTGSSTNYALNLQNPNSFGDFGNHISDFRATGLNGINVLNFEAKIENAYLTGQGNEVANGNGIDINQFDTSLDNVLVQEYESGVDTFKGLQANDLHIVRCRRSLTFREQGGPVQLVNTFIDTPSEYGVRCFDQGALQMTNTYFLRTGTADTASTAAAIFFDEDSKENTILSAQFIQPDLTTVDSLVKHQAGSVDNLYVGFRGDYKMDEDVQRERMRNQACIGFMGEWARFNNVPRKSRARAASIAAGAQATLTFHLDFTYDTAETFNTVLFYGKYVSRTSSSEGAFGDLFIPIQYTDFGSSPVINKISGDSNNVWTVVSATLTGNSLEVVVQNDSTNSSSISVELERSLDARGDTF